MIPGLNFESPGLNFSLLASAAVPREGWGGEGRGSFQGTFVIPLGTHSVKFWESVKMVPPRGLVTSYSFAAARGMIEGKSMEWGPEKQSLKLAL